jgi:uncharacterized protein YjbJ (UPF0337 family)
MTWDQIEGNWLHFKGRLRHNWVKLTDEDITRINGRRDELVAEREVGAWMRSQRHAA